MSTCNCSPGAAQSHLISHRLDFLSCFTNFFKFNLTMNFYTAISKCKFLHKHRFENPELQSFESPQSSIVRKPSYDALKNIYNGQKNFPTQQGKYSRKY